MQLLRPCLVSLALVGPLLAQGHPDARLPRWSPELRQAILDADIAAVRAIVESHEDALDWFVGELERGRRSHGVGALGLAVEFDELEVAAALLELGADPMGPDAQGVRPLTLVRSAEMVRLLVGAGANVRRAEQGRRPLLEEIPYDFPVVRQRTARALREEGARVTVSSALELGWYEDARKRIARGASPDPMLLDRAVRLGQRGAVEVLLDAGLDPNDLPPRPFIINDTSSDNLVTTAMWNGHPDVALLLLESGASLPKASDRWDLEGWQTIRGQSFGGGGATIQREGNLLDRAADEGHAGLVRALLSRGFDPDGGNEANEDTPLHRAVWRGNTDAALALLDGGADITLPSHGADIALTAAAAGQAELHDVLIEHGAARSLCAAAALGRLDEVRAHLAAGADVNEADPRCKRPPLAWAVHRGHSAVAEELLARGADAGAYVGRVSARPRTWATVPRSVMPRADTRYRIDGHVIDVALSAGDLGMAMRLLEGGARIDGDTLWSLVALEDESARDVLERALELGFAGSVEDGHALDALARLLGSRLAQEEAQARFDLLDAAGLTDVLVVPEGKRAGQNVLQLVRRAPQRELVARLVERGLEVDHETAACHDLAERIRELDSCGVVAGESRRSLVHTALLQDNAAAVEALLEGATEEDPVDELDQADEAVYRGSLRTLELFRSRGAIDYTWGSDRNPKLRGNESLLHKAGSSPPLIEELLELGLDPNARDRGGWTPLHKVGVHHGDPGSVHALIEGGAEVELRCDSGATPLHMMVGPRIMARNLECASFLLEAGADPMAIGRHGQRAFVSFLWAADDEEERAAVIELLSPYLPDYVVEEL